MKPFLAWTLWFWFWCIMICTIICVVNAVGCAAMTDCIDATCRVTSGDNRHGTGVVFEISKGRVYVLTNAHVATTPVMKLEFWRDGHQSKKIRGSTVLRSASRDVAVIAIDSAAFDNLLPAIIPLAPVNYQLRSKQAITSVGCAGGSWSTAWKGHVLGYWQAGNNDLKFIPPPANGRSGSAIFDADGTKIVALLHARKAEEVGGGSVGLAVNLQNVYAAVYGRAVKTNYLVKDREVFWPPPVLAQCGPRGCPTPPGSPTTPWRLSPYRHRQDEINRRQDEQIQDLYPTRPMTPVVPPPVVRPPVIEPPIVVPEVPEIKNEMSTQKIVALFQHLFIVCMAMLIGAVAGIATQWKKTYSK